MRKFKKVGNVNIAEKNLTAFMKGMENNDMRQLVAAATTMTTMMTVWRSLGISQVAQPLLASVLCCITG